MLTPATKKSFATPFSFSFFREYLNTCCIIQKHSPSSPTPIGFDHPASFTTFTVTFGLPFQQPPDAME
jgi:hypothetical protein